MPKYNHAFTVAFSVENHLEDGHKTPFRELIHGMAKRMVNLMEEEAENTNGALEAFECYDTYEVQGKAEFPPRGRLREACEAVLSRCHCEERSCDVCKTLAAAMEREDVD